jgi:hypothetical protein
MAWLKKFLDSPANVNGLVLLFGSAIGVLTQYLDHTTSLSVLVGTIAAGVVHIIRPDSALTADSLAQLFIDAQNAAQTKSPAAIVGLVKEVANDATGPQVTGDKK